MTIKTQAYIDTLTAQRDNALNGIVECNGIIAELRDQLEKSLAENERLKNEQNEPVAD